MTSENTPKHEADHEGAQPEPGSEVFYPSRKVLIPVVLSICLASLLASLDRTIVGVAVPAISNDFGTFADVAWYESAYLLTYAAFQLPMAKVYTYFRAKWVFCIFVLIFLIGSTLCAAAPNSISFIIGRAVAGVGSAGISTGGQVLFIDLLPLEKRPKYQGFLAATFGLAAILGPLVGGIFSTHSTWRWCFWINLPIGGLALGVLAVILPPREAPKKRSQDSLRKRVLEFDPIGTSLVLPGLTLLLLGLQWGGAGGEWQSHRCLGALISGLVLLMAFVTSQWWVGENNTVPPRLIRQRSIAAASAASFGFGSSLIITTFYLPIWYQAVRDLSAQAAGVRMLAYFLTTVFFVIGSGAAISKLGYYTPWLIGGTAIIAVGCGLLATLDINASDARAIGFQVLVGAGMGCSLAQSINAVQTTLPREDIPTGLTLVNFMNFVGGTVSVSISQAILTDTIVDGLRRQNPNLDITITLEQGATRLFQATPEEQLPILLKAYNTDLHTAFFCAMAFALLAFTASCFMEWRTVRSDNQDDRSHNGRETA